MAPLPFGQCGSFALFVGGAAVALDDFLVAIVLLEGRHDAFIVL